MYVRQLWAFGHLPLSTTVSKLPHAWKRHVAPPRLKEYGVYPWPTPVSRQACFQRAPESRRWHVQEWTAWLHLLSSFHYPTSESLGGERDFLIHAQPLAHLRLSQDYHHQP